MCEPVTILATSALVLSAAGVGLQAYSNYQETKAENAAAEYNAQLLERNAQIADMQAQQAAQRGELEEKQFRLRLSQFKGEQRASFGASGAVVDTGSPLDVLVDTAEQGELDALTIRHNAAIEVWGIRNQSAGYRAESSLYRAKKRSPGFAAGTTLLTGAGQIAGQAASYGYASAGGAAKAGV